MREQHERYDHRDGFLVTTILTDGETGGEREFELSSVM